MGKRIPRSFYDALAGRGVKRIPVKSAKSADSDTVAPCAELGMETAFGCPRMALGGGIRRFHSFLSGVLG